MMPTDDDVEIGTESLASLVGELRAGLHLCQVEKAALRGELTEKVEAHQEQLEILRERLKMSLDLAEARAREQTWKEALELMLSWPRPQAPPGRVP
jgi:hypothetical protein